MFIIQAIDKLKRYLALTKSSLELDYHYCHGITLLWLLKMSLDEEDGFYSFLSRLLACEDNDFDAMSNEIERFLQDVEWLQHSRKYAHDVCQLDIDKLIDFQQVHKLSLLMTEDELTNLLDLILIDGNYLCLFSETHTIGIVKRGNQVHLFDTASKDFHPMMIPNNRMLLDTIIKSLFKLSKWYACRMPIGLAMMSCSSRECSKPTVDELQAFARKVIITASADKIPNWGDMTNLHLACELEDIGSTTLILEQHADPNLLFRKWRPLHVAAIKGNMSLVELLLERGANPAFMNHKGRTAAYKAEKAGHTEIAERLRVDAPVMIPVPAPSPADGAGKNDEGKCGRGWG